MYMVPFNELRSLASDPVIAVVGEVVVSCAGSDFMVGFAAGFDELHDTKNQASSTMTNRFTVDTTLRSRKRFPQHASCPTKVRYAGMPSGMVNHSPRRVKHAQYTSRGDRTTFEFALLASVSHFVPTMHRATP